MKLYPFLFLFILLYAPGSGQQANNWYFGNHAGLSFNTSPPTPLLNSQMYTHEGCSTVSDSTGSLLFYTDGRNVWNRDHLIMPNGSGLLGHESSTHSAIVIPKPGSNHIYYIFTADAHENVGVNGYRYSMLDMNLDNGRGDITSTKNILLYGPSTEKLTAASHANGIDIWVISKDLNNFTFRSWLVTCNGIDMNPVISTVAPVNGSTFGFWTGGMKISPDGTRLASARNVEGKWDLFKFNNVTGVISDRIMVTQSAQLGSYGIEFSPNSQLVYVNGDYTYQFKIDLYDSAAISNSKYRVDSVFVVHEALQLGPDGKIYSNTYPNSSVINNPDVYGVGCNYAEQAISLGGRSGFAGYPTFFGRLVTNYNVDYNYSFQPDCKTVDFAGTSNVPGPLTWSWDFGDGSFGSGQAVTHVFPPAPNQFLVTLTINNPNVCGGSATRTKMISFDRIAPTANFGFTTACNDLRVAFDDSSFIGVGAQIISYSWDFGDGNNSSLQDPVHDYLNYGTYQVRLIVESDDRCHTKDTIIKTVHVAAKPVVNFNFTNGCFTEAFRFTDLSTIAAGNINAWFWDFGDGNISTIQNPVHSYTSAGIYTVKFVAGSEFNCSSDTLSAVVVAGAMPAVDFILPAICLLDATAHFTNSTTIQDTSTVNYLWNFDDPNATPSNPNTSSALNPIHIYSAAAVYQVKLVAVTYLGCRDSIIKVFTVNGPVPRASFSVNDQLALCSNRDVVIKDSSYVDFGNITGLKIYWGDGDSTIDNDPGQMPNGKLYDHRYANFGSPAAKTFIIRMFAYSGVICVDEISKNIVLHASPKIRFDPIPAVCHESAPVVIAATEIWGLPGSGVFSGAGIIDPLAGVFDPSSVTEGDHLITYSFTTGFGCRADSSRWIHINPTPLSSFDHTHGCLPNAQIQFSSNSTVSGGTVDSLIHLWDFGDPLAGPGNANTSTVINPVHSYHSMDTFNVHLKTTSLRGCVHDTALKLYPGISIFPQPKAEFKIDSLKPICAGSPVYFINKGSGGGQAVTRYNWDFGDGNFSSATNPNHVYQESGIYSVSSWLQNEKGCLSDTALSSLIVHSVPKAGFSYGSTCIGQPVQFTDRSTNALGTITAWKWNLGNGNMETVQHPATTYTGFRPYMISLKVATANGCVSAIANKVVSIQPVNVFAGRDTAIAIGEPLQLIASGGTSYSWTPSTGLNDPNIYNPIAVLRNDHQTYFVKGVTSDGCLGFDTINIKVFTKAGIFLPNAFTPNGDGLNDQLQPICIGIKKLRYFQVFDRWGNLVFSSTNIFDIWNARLKGEPVPMGSYTWIAEALTFDDRLIQRKGSVLVIR